MTQEEKWEKLGEWKEKGMIYRCPGGMIHLSYKNITLHFSQEEFLEFARVVTEAAALLSGSTPPSQDDWQDKLSINFSDN